MSGYPRYGATLIVFLLAAVAVVSPAKAAVGYQLAAAGTSGRVTTPAETLLPPPTPVIVSIEAGSLVAHIDYVRLTYAFPDGQTAPSAEVANEVAKGSLTRVVAPQVVPGAIGYDVYAVANNGDTNTGHVLQNDAPIPFGHDFDEPATGWRVSGERLSEPTPDRTVEALAFDGQSVAVPRTPTIGGNVLFPRSYAPQPVVVTIGTVSATAMAPGGFDFSFDRDVRFADLPSFYLAATGDLQTATPDVLILRDESTNATIATYDRSPFGVMTFISQFWHDAPGVPFAARAGHRYSVRVSSRSNGMFAMMTSSKQDYSLRAAGISAALHVPPVSDGDPTMFVHVTRSVPLGIPTLESGKCGDVLAYVALTLQAPATLDGSMSATVDLPHGSQTNGSYAVALYDQGFWARGWSCGVAHGRARRGVVTFQADLDRRRLYPRTYVFALYLQSGTSRETSASRATDTDRRPILTVLGDSTTLVTYVQPSGIRCPVKIEAAPYCQYIDAPAENYAALAGTRAGYRVLNLSYVGAQSTADWIFGEAALTLEVPQIPHDSAVVVIACGLLDTAQNDFRDVSDRVDELTRAVKAAAPHSAILYVGVRYFNGTAEYPVQRRAIDAWDDREAALAAAPGAFIDLRPILPAGWSALTPDGVHFTRAAHAMLAARLQAALPPVP